MSFTFELAVRRLCEFRFGQLTSVMRTDSHGSGAAPSWWRPELGGTT